LATKDWGSDPCRDALRWNHRTSALTDSSSAAILGGLDLSPLVALLLISVLEALVLALLAGH